MPPIIDLTEGCGCAMHGRKSGEKLIYRCGRYVNSGGRECHHNTVDGDAMLRLVLDALVECVGKAGGREAILDRPRLRGRQVRQAGGPTASARRHRLRPRPPSRTHPRDPARQCRRCPASPAATAAVGRPAGSPAGPRRRDAREGGWRRTQHSGPPGVLPGSGGRFRCLGRR